MLASNKRRMLSLETIYTDSHEHELQAAIRRIWPALVADEEYLNLRHRALLECTPADEAQRCDEMSRQRAIEIAQRNGEHELVRMLQSSEDTNTTTNRTTQ
ncbi:hypothetical protein [Lacipirellula sp.]|uniref:hypothetical protein n=1 Tax=Lacipirellula sp. TaxID=2691419 RepID=UPI003D14C5D9